MDEEKEVKPTRASKIVDSDQVSTPSYSIEEACQILALSQRDCAVIARKYKNDSRSLSIADWRAELSKFFNII